MDDNEITGETRAVWKEGRFQVAAFLKYLYLPDDQNPDALLGRSYLLRTLKEGSLEQLAAFVDTLASLHLALLTEDSGCDSAEVMADLHSLTEPSWDPFFERMVQSVRPVYTVPSEGGTG